MAGASRACGDGAQGVTNKSQTGDSAEFRQPLFSFAMKNILFPALRFGSLVTLAAGKLLADDAAAPDTRYGWFNALDHRSSYGQGAFPEPFLIDDSDLETGEFRLDWLRTASGSDHSDILHPEIEYGIGLLTLELEVPYERDVAGGVTTEGLANIDVGARYPFYQFVAQNGAVDTTLGAAVEIGIPTTSPVSHDTEVVPKIFNDLKLGNFTVQSIFGYSMLIGPDGDGGLNTFEYGFVFGYDIPHKTLPLPGIEKLIPVFELSGETALSKGQAGQNNLTADVGVRANLVTIGRIQARPGVVFVFPVDNNSRADQHWGVMTSLVFEF